MTVYVYVDDQHVWAVLGVVLACFGLGCYTYFLVRALSVPPQHKEGDDL